MTRYDPQKHHRRSIRLCGHNYARPGAYFVTICTHERECLFGDVINGTMGLNEYGQIAHEEWVRSGEIRQEIRLDEFVVMPNHVHGIITIVGAGSPRPGSKGAETAPLRRPTLGQIVAYFKYQSTKRINEIRGAPGTPLWQRNYYEHVVRNEDEWNEIRTYIIENPLRWELDENHPNRLPRLE